MVVFIVIDLYFLCLSFFFFFFFNDTATTEIYTLSLHDALPIYEPVPVRPGAHYHMGGVETDNDGATELEGLYAAGEVACVSVHGANRLGGNSLMETITFGRR